MIVIRYYSIMAFIFLYSFQKILHPHFPEDPACTCLQNPGSRKMQTKLLVNLCRIWYIYKMNNEKQSYLSKMGGTER